MKTKVHTGHAPAAIGPYAQGLRDPLEFVHSISSLPV